MSLGSYVTANTYIRDNFDTGAIMGATWTFFAIFDRTLYVLRFKILREIIVENSDVSLTWHGDQEEMYKEHGNAKC